MTTPQTLAAETQGRRFGPDEAAALTAYLDDVEEHTLIYPIEDPRQVSLDPTYRVSEGGGRLSWLAVRQICRTLGAGLGTFLSDLSGHRRAPAADEAEFFSVADAAAVLNLAVRRRFGRGLAGMQAIRNTRTDLVDAVVGRGYRRLPNRDFLERVQDVLEASGQRLRFQEALVVGRRATLRYMHVDPCYAADDDRFTAVHPGFTFSNSEVGDGSVRATPFLWFDPSGVALMPYNTASRVAHTGRDFPRRMQRLLDKTMERWQGSPLFAGGVGPALALMEEHRLGFTGGDEAADDARFRELASQLRHPAGLSIATARRVLRRALFAGGREEAPADATRAARRQTWGTRSALDVFCAFLRESEETPLHVAARERLEQIAYLMLSGRFRPE